MTKYSVEATKAILHGNQIRRDKRGRPEIEIDGTWYRLCRADLFGQSVSYTLIGEPYEELRRFLADTCIYGSIIVDDVFRVNDSTTDG